MAAGTVVVKHPGSVRRIASKNDVGTPKVISQTNCRVEIVTRGPAGRSGSAASLSSDSGNMLSLGTDGGLFADSGFGYLFVADDGADQTIGPVSSTLRNNGGNTIDRFSNRCRRWRLDRCAGVSMVEGTLT